MIAAHLHGQELRVPAPYLQRNPILLQNIKIAVVVGCQTRGVFTVVARRLEYSSASVAHRTGA